MKRLVLGVFCALLMVVGQSAALMTTAEDASATVLFIPVGDAFAKIDGQPYEAVVVDEAGFEAGGTRWNIDAAAGLYRDESNPARTLTVAVDHGDGRYDCYTGLE